MISQFKKLFFITIILLSFVGNIQVFAQEPALPQGGGDVDGGNSVAIPSNSQEGQNNINANANPPDYSTQTTNSSSGDWRVDAVRFESDNKLTNAEAQKQLDAEIGKTVGDPNSQAAIYDRKSQEADPNLTEAAKGALTDVVGCSAGQILGNIIASAVSSAISSAFQVVTDKIEETVKVPVVVGGTVQLDTKTQASAKVGTTVGAFGIGILALPSWDSIAYCVVNAMIEYVANSTIAWIQGGFEGNPSFVNNPEQFFKDLADVEASAFLQELAYGSLGLNICEPFRAQVVLSIARNHVGNQQGYGGVNGYSQGGFGGGGGNVGYGGCTLDDIKGNLDNFLGGNFESGGWSSWFQISQVDSNNPYATYFNLNANLEGAISKKTTLAKGELDWGKGFMSFRKCEEKTPKEKQSGCPIVSPGTVIQGQLEKTLGLAKDRLVLAEKFDQVIAAVVNQLINTALDKVLEVAVE